MKYYIRNSYAECCEKCDRCNSFFLNLEAKRKINNSNNQIKTLREKFIKELLGYYENLFRRNIKKNNVNFSNINMHNKLSNKAKLLCWTPISEVGLQRS